MRHFRRLFTDGANPVPLYLTVKYRCGMGYDMKPASSRRPVYWMTILLVIQPLPNVFDTDVTAVVEHFAIIIHERLTQTLVAVRRGLVEVLAGQHE